MECGLLLWLDWRKSVWVGRGFGSGEQGQHRYICFYSRIALAGALPAPSAFCLAEFLYLISLLICIFCWTASVSPSKAPPADSRVSSVSVSGSKSTVFTDFFWGFSLASAILGRLREPTWTLSMISEPAYRTILDSLPYLFGKLRCQIDETALSMTSATVHYFGLN